MATATGHIKFVGNDTMSHIGYANVEREKRTARAEDLKRIGQADCRRRCVGNSFHQPSQTRHFAVM